MVHFDMPASSNPSIVYAMTPTQELLNAVTMILPTAVLAINVWQNPNRMVVILLVGSSMHLPVSFTYHLGAAFRRYPDRIDNDMRRLDQSLQHVIGAMFAFALSGSLPYLLLNTATNAVGIIDLWDSRKSNDGKRWMPLTVSVIGYTLPMLWRGDFPNYSLATGSMLIGGLAFVPEFNKKLLFGWGHTVFHIMLVVYAQALADSARHL